MTSQERPWPINDGAGESGPTFCIDRRTMASCFLGAIERAPFLGFCACLDVLPEPVDALRPLVEFCAMLETGARGEREEGGRKERRSGVGWRSRVNFRRADQGRLAARAVRGESRDHEQADTGARGAVVMVLSLPPPPPPPLDTASNSHSTRQTTVMDDDDMMDSASPDAVGQQQQPDAHSKMLWVPSTRPPLPASGELSPASWLELRRHLGREIALGS